MRTVSILLLLAAIGLCAITCALGVEAHSVRPASATRQVDPPPMPPQPMPMQPHPMQPHPMRAETIPQGAPARGAITLDELQAIAMANNPTLAEAAARVDAARGRWVQAGLYPNPRAGYMADEIGMAGRAGMQGFAVSQEIVRGGKLGLDRARVSHEIVQAQEQFAAQRWRVMNDVRIQFYNLLVAQRTMQLSDELVMLGERGLTTADRLFRPPVEEVSRVDVLQSRVELNTARLAADAARARYLGVWRRLAAIVGAPEMQPTLATGDLEAAIPQLTWEESLSRLLGASPELAAARAGVQRACWALRRAQAEPIGNLDVQVSAQHDNDSGDDIAGVTIMVPVPIHNKNQGAIRAAAAELREAQAAVARKELELQARLATAFERYANARQQVERLARDVLPDVRTSLDLVNKGYEQGEFAIVNVLDAQRTFARTNLMYLKALEELWESSTAIEGFLLMDSLGMPAERAKAPEMESSAFGVQGSAMR